MNWIKTCIFLMILLIPPAVINDTEKCEPFHALFIWHTSSEDDNYFIKGRRFLFHFIDGLPQGTDVILKTTGTDASIDVQFQKEAKNNTWMETILQHKPPYSGNHVIPSSEISEAVFNYLDQNKMPKRAEEVFLIVTNKSVIDNEVRVKEVLRKKKTFVVVYGKQTYRNVWTDLATDNNHLKELQNSLDWLNSTEKSIRNRSCKDARLLCDTDQYWTGERCYRCSYICPPNPLEHCLRDCPYFDILDQYTEYVYKTAVNDQSKLKIIITMLTIITSFVLVLISIVVILYCRLGRESLMPFITGKMEEIRTKSKESAETPSPPFLDSDKRVKNKNAIEITESTSNNSLSHAEKKMKSYFVVGRNLRLPEPDYRSGFSFETKALVER